jgi:uncharacterized protein (DUF433 family)
MKRNSTHKWAPVHETPAYGVAEAARYLKIAPSTLRSWVAGRSYPRDGGTGYFMPLIVTPGKSESRLSFANLIEAHVLRALRTEHGVPVKAVRNALRYAERELDIKHLLLDPRLRTTAGSLFLERYGQLLNLSLSGQYALEAMLKNHLARIVWKQRTPVRLYPFIAPDESDARRLIAIDPSISFGRPVLVSRGVTTAAIRDRVDAGESLEDLAADYDVDIEEVSAALVYERAA